MRVITTVWVSLWCAALTGPLHAQAITKCQDAEGKWHYGTYAAEQCGDGPVTELRDSGVILEVREAPPSVEELQAVKERQLVEQAELIQREEKHRIDRQLLEKYPSEQVILDLRDQRIAELGKQIEFNQGQLVQLKAEFSGLGEPANDLERQEAHELEQLIGRFERAIERGQEALDTTRSDYGLLMDRYRQIDREQ